MSEVNKELLTKHVAAYLEKLQGSEYLSDDDANERRDRQKYYESWTKERLLNISEEEFFEYLSKLWAMKTWGNKKYYVDKVISDNGVKHIGTQLAMLVWGENDIAERWDDFRVNTKGMGIAMMSEILCHTHPNKYLLWNRRANIGFDYLEVPSLPRYDYQLTGEKYKELSNKAKVIQQELQEQSGKDKTLLDVDYFIWGELQVLDKLPQHAGLIDTKPNDAEQGKMIDKEPKDASKFIHDEIRDKIAKVGDWLGFETDTERKVADGSVVDVVWEAAIGNMGRVIYVFEVQTKGNIDSLLVNLLKSLNNPAVQGVVAVSDGKQLEKIRKHAAALDGLRGKVKYWDYEEVLAVHGKFEVGYDSINRLGLVPQGF